MIFVSDIQRLVAERRRVPPRAMRERNRGGLPAPGEPPIAKARQEAMFVAVKLTHHSRSRIAHFFGLKDNTTVSHAVREVEQRIGSDLAERAFIEEMLDALREKAA